MQPHLLFVGKFQPKVILGDRLGLHPPPPRMIEKVSHVRLQLQPPSPPPNLQVLDLPMILVNIHIFLCCESLPLV